MFTLLNRWSVRQRVWMIVGLFIGGIVCGSVVDVLTLRDTLWREKELKTRHLVESAYGVLEHYYRLQLNGKLDQGAAQAAAIGAIRAMRYEGTEYFWLNDLGMPFPRMVMHPTRPELDGALLDAAPYNVATGWRQGDDGDFVSLAGRRNLFAVMVEASAHDGRAYVTYDWPKPKEGGGVSAEDFAKLSYVKRFPPWGWLLGSGVYMDDVGEALRSLVWRNLLLASGGGGVLLLLAWAIARSITRPLHQTALTMRQIGRDDGNLALRLPADGNSEFSQLSRGFNEMLDHLQARDAELAKHREHLEELVVQRSSELRATNLALEKELAEHKSAEHKIHESRAQMRALLDATRESVLLLDPEGVILEINAFAAQRFGQSPEALVGRNFFALIPPELAATRRAIIRQVAATGEPTESDDRRGSVHFHNSLYPVKNEAGVVESVAVFAKDVTEQHRAKGVDDIFRHLDSVLLKWQMNLESIAQMFCDGIVPVFGLSAAWIARAEQDGRLAAMAGAGGSADILGRLRDSDLRWKGENGVSLPAEAVVRFGHRRIIRSSDGVAGSPETSALMQGAPVALLMPLSLRGTTWGVLVLCGSEPTQFDSPEVPVRLGALASRLGASLESAQQQEWLTLFDAALAGIGNGVFITDAGGVIRWVNRSFVELSGYTPEQLVGQNPKMLGSGVHGTDFYRRFWETILAGNPWRGDIVNARPNGSRYTVRQTITPLVDMGGEIGHFVAILEDISVREAATKPNAMLPATGC